MGPEGARSRKDRRENRSELHEGERGHRRWAGPSRHRGWDDSRRRGGHDGQTRKGNRTPDRSRLSPQERRSSVGSIGSKRQIGGVSGDRRQNRQERRREREASMEGTVMNQIIDMDNFIMDIQASTRNVNISNVVLPERNMFQVTRGS